MRGTDNPPPVTTRAAHPIPAIEFPEALPVSARRDEIARLLAAHQVLIVCGETGSGKTTQLPKIALQLGRGLGAGGQGLIGHTQPRRIAASSVAKRIAQELNSPLGDVVGYKVRFQDRLQPGASVKLMTDGILLAETQSDPLLRAYDTLIVDEAHERSLNIDFLLGHLRQILPRRPELKLIVTSATIDAERFANHFADAQGPAPVIQVSGRLYPVQIRWRPFEDSRSYGLDEAIADAIDELWRDGGAGDVLVFLPGEREIRDAADHLRQHFARQQRGGAAGGAFRGPVPEVLPLFARLDELTGTLPKDADPQLLHYLHKKSYQKARLFLELLPASGKSSHAVLNAEDPRVMAIARPYLGEMVGVYSDWTPLQDRGRLFPEEVDATDPWQFRNVLVR